MAVIAFFTKRDLPIAPCASALAAAGFAATGLRVARGIHDPGHTAPSAIMPQCLPGVDAATADWPGAGSARASIPGQHESRHVIPDFDIGLWPEMAEHPFDLAVLAACGTGRFTFPGPACRAVFLPCSRFGSERPRAAEAPPVPVAGTWIPILTRADVSSLASGLPLPRARAAAAAVARALFATLPAAHRAAASAP